MNYDKFCGICGKELRVVETNGYNTQTGQKNTEKICSSGMCGHYGINHNYVEYKRTFAKILVRCTKCGSHDWEWKPCFNDPLG